MSMYAEYIHEKTNNLIMETEKGFATYKYLDEQTVYILDIYVLPELRRTNAASTIGDNIVEIAKAKGCNRLLGSIVPSNKGSTESLKFLLAYGFRIESASNDFVVFKKEI